MIPLHQERSHASGFSHTGREDKIIHLNIECVRYYQHNTQKRQDYVLSDSFYLPEAPPQGQEFEVRKNHTIHELEKFVDDPEKWVSITSLKPFFTPTDFERQRVPAFRCSDFPFKVRPLELEAKPFDDVNSDPRYEGLYNYLLEFYKYHHMIAQTIMNLRSTAIMTRSLNRAINELTGGHYYSSIRFIADGIPEPRSPVNFQITYLNLCFAARSLVLQFENSKHHFQCYYEHYLSLIAQTPLSRRITHVHPQGDEEDDDDVLMEMDNEIKPTRQPTYADAVSSLTITIPNNLKTGATASTSTTSTSSAMSTSTTTSSGAKPKSKPQRNKTDSD
jgi:hypothetical protein